MPPEDKKLAFQISFQVAKLSKFLHFHFNDFFSCLHNRSDVQKKDVERFREDGCKVPATILK